MKRIVFLFIFIVLMGAGALALMRASGEHERAQAPVIPRFASFRSNEANMRTGPGTRYPIEWVFRAQGMPVEIIGQDDEDIWRHVRDTDGDEGWIHKTELSSKRSGVVTGGMHDLMQANDGTPGVAAHMQPGAVGKLISCGHEWCRMRFGDVKGYLRKSEFWGAYPDEIFD